MHFLHYVTLKFLTEEVESLPHAVNLVVFFGCLVVLFGQWVTQMEAGTDRSACALAHLLPQREPAWAGLMEDEKHVGQTHSSQSLARSASEHLTPRHKWTKMSRKALLPPTWPQIGEQRLTLTAGFVVLLCIVIAVIDNRNIKPLGCCKD